MSKKVHTTLPLKSSLGKASVNRQTFGLLAAAWLRCSRASLLGAKSVRIITPSSKRYVMGRLVQRTQMASQVTAWTSWTTASRITKMIEWVQSSFSTTIHSCKSRERKNNRKRTFGEQVCCRAKSQHRTQVELVISSSSACTCYIKDLYFNPKLTINDSRHQLMNEEV